MENMLRLLSLLLAVGLLSFSAPLAAATSPLLPPLPPDLTILKAVKAAENPFQVRVQVANIGKGNAAACNLRMHAMVNGTLKMVDIAVPAINAGQNTWVTVNAGSPVNQVSQAWLRVDDPPAVSETNEGNNKHQVI